MATGTTIRFRRQTDIFNPDNYRDLKVLIVGAGGIGSITALALAKMGIQNITIFDDDKIEEHNIPNQFYPVNDIGADKVDALSDVIMEYTGVETTSHSIKVDEETVITPDPNQIVIVTTDNMSSRKLVYDKVKNTINKGFIDARMGGEVFRLYTLNPIDRDHQKFYEQYLHTEEETEDQTCTSRAIIYNVLMVASLIANQVKKIATADPYKKEIIYDFNTGVYLSE